MIETERFRIRVASREEMERFIEKQTDGELIAAYNEMLQGAVEHPEQWDWYAIWMIETKDGAHVGDLSFKGFGADGSVEIGYGVSEEYRNRGVATEAVGAAVRWALDQPGVTRVEAETEPGNKASQRVLEKCGFVPTGTVGEEGPRFAVYKK
ncbi:MAG: GNAT family N-acetyltransferase [Clostridia bacterium]|nr:GNAT family N-acetyltransferase [Clostridia bacterium]